MSDATELGKRPEVGHFVGFDHLNFFVSNAKQAATYYCIRFGFEMFAYKGLETKSRDYATWAIRQNKIVMTFTSPLNPVDTEAARVSAARTLYSPRLPFRT